MPVDVLWINSLCSTSPFSVLSGDHHHEISGKESFQRTGASFMKYMLVTRAIST